MKWFKENVTTIVVNAIIGIALFFIGVWWNARETRTKYIEYYVTQSIDLTRSLEEIGDSVMFLINSKKVESLSSISVYVINNTNRDYEDVPIYIDLYTPGQDINVISSNYYDHNRSQESITAERVSESRFDGGVRYGYNLKIMNRGNKPVLEVKFLVETSATIDYQVQVNKASMDIKELSIGESDKSLSFEIILYLVIGFLLVAMPIILIVINYQRRIIKSTVYERFLTRDK